MEIRRSRENAWVDYVSRRHEILRVYAFDAAGLDLLVIGKVEMGLRNRKVVEEEFVARFVVDETTVIDQADAGAGASAHRARLKFSRVWSVRVCGPYDRGYGEYS